MGLESLGFMEMGVRGFRFGRRGVVVGSSGVVVGSSGGIVVGWVAL